jgi:hypothetical protein
MQPKQNHLRPQNGAGFEERNPVNYRLSKHANLPTRNP